MARLAKIIKNLKKQKLFEKFGKKRKELQLKMKDQNISINEKMFIQRELQRLPKGSSIVQQRKICKRTGRSRGNNRFGLSRLELRRLFCMGYIPGLRKASW
ncbi:MAG: 30S ribosomal protein S14 [Thiotrichales bacterium]|nr:MAG: 30S ribosomal protein S14 [Thiotrichales bacterium]